MQFRPCIDLRNGKVTQIVGSTLKATPAAADVPETETKKRKEPDSASSDDKQPSQPTSQSETKVVETDVADENFVTDKPSAYFAKLYKEHKLTGGHIIMLGPGNKEAALSALKAYPGGMQVGGGITPDNAKEFLDAGASHVIVTSYVFSKGKIDFGRLDKLVECVGRERLVLDLSCRRREGQGDYYVVTDRWQKFTDFALNKENVARLSKYCNEFLVHGVDVEGKKQGIEEELVQKLGEWSSIPITYAGGVRSFEDLLLVNKLGKGKVDITIGSALDIFGGDLRFEKMLDFIKNDL